MRALRLPAHVGFCRIGSRHVFLDIAADRYFGLGESLDHAFSRLVDGDPIDPETVSALIAKGVLADCGEDAPEPGLKPCAFVPAQHGFPIVGSPAWWPTPRVLLRRGLWTRRVRRRSLSNNVGGLQARRASNRSGSVDPAVVARVARAYRTAELLRSERGQCLPTSLALMDELIGLGMIPQLVFGVQLGPFQAHCWVELTGLLVSEQPERVRPFTPIMVI